MWLAEIHVAPERSVCSAPLTLASAIAARTKRMKIGTGVQVLPLCHPLRLAEEAATVDQISHGRLIFGVGRSGFPRTYEAYGVPYGESRERFAETLEILKRAWTEESFSYKGKYYSFDNVALTPKPYQKPWPEIRIAANSADTFPAIAKLGHAVFVAVRLGTLEELEPEHHGLSRGLEGSRASGRGQGVSARSGLCRRDRQGRRVEEPEESIMYFYRYLGERLEDSATRAGVRAVEDRAARGRRLQDDQLRGRAARKADRRLARSGSTDRLMGLKEKLGLDGILRRDELRHQDPARAGHEVAAAAVRRGEAGVQLDPDRAMGSRRSTHPTARHRQDGLERSEAHPRAFHGRIQRSSSSSAHVEGEAQ